MLVFRKQFLITIAYGITIHTSQSLTFPDVDIENTIFACGQTYIAISMATSLKGLHIINLDPEK